MNLNELCTNYLEIHKKPFIRSSTYDRYGYALKHIPPIPLYDVNEDTLQIIINSLISEKLSRTSIKSYCNLIPPGGGGSSTAAFNQQLRAD